MNMHVETIETPSSDWSAEKSTIVFFAENSHVHSRCKIRSYFFFVLEKYARVQAEYDRLQPACRLYDRIPGVTPRTSQCNPIFVRAARYTKGPG